MAGRRHSPGLQYDFCYNVVKDGVHDLNASLLNQLDVDHTRLTFRSKE